MNLIKKTTITILLGIILLGAILRFYNLGSTSFVADEFLDINSSMAYAETGIWQNWDFNFGKVNVENEFSARDERAWIYKWQVAQVLKVFPATEGSARAVSAFWGIITIILIYFVAVYFTKKKEIGLISAFLFAISLAGIIYDRKLRMYAMFFPVFLVFSWLFYRFLEEDYRGKIKIAKVIWEKIGVNVIYLIPALILGIISLLTHQLTANVVFVILIYAVIRLVRQKNEFSLHNKYFLSLAFLAAGYIGAAVFYKNQLAVYTKELEFFGSHWVYFSKIFSDYAQVLPALLLSALGIYYLCIKQKLQKQALWLGVSLWGVVLLAMFIWNRNTGDQYIFFILSFNMILIASGIYYLAEFFGTNLAKFGPKAYYIPIALSLIFLPNYGYFLENNNTYRQTSESDSPNYKKIFAYFKKAHKEGEVLVSRNFRNFYWKGMKVKVYDFGGEISHNKLTLDKIQTIQKENPRGWLIISENDDVYIFNDAMDYITKNLERVSNSQVRGKVLVYRWGNKEN